MNENKFLKQAEVEKSKGLNVKVRSFYFRHAEKASGSVGDTGGISKAAISEKGKIESAALGSSLPGVSAKDGFKIGWSGIERTLETGKFLTGGYLAKDLGEGHKRKEFKPREKIELSDKNMPKEFVDSYIFKWNGKKEEVMEETSIDKEQFSELSPTEQAKIAESAEESVISEWLEDENSVLNKLYSPEKAAAHLAVIVKRDINMPERLNSGSEVDLFRMTHKTITEPLLIKIIVLENGEKPKKLEDIGGSLRLNDGWEIKSETNQDGKKDIKLFLYRVKQMGGKVINDMPAYPRYETKEYKINLEELNRLADEGVKSENKRINDKINKN